MSRYSQSALIKEGEVIKLIIIESHQYFRFYPSIYSFLFTRFSP